MYSTRLCLDVLPLSPEGAGSTELGELMTVALEEFSIAAVSAIEEPGALASRENTLLPRFN